MIKSADNPTDPIFSEYLPELSKLLNDSNLIILEKTIFCIQNICNTIEPQFLLSINSFEWKEMIKSLIEKGYVVNKMVIKGQVEEILIFLARKVEREGVVEACVGLLGHKNPKVNKKLMFHYIFLFQILSYTNIFWKIKIIYY